MEKRQIGVIKTVLYHRSNPRCINSESETPMVIEIFEGQTIEDAIGKENRFCNNKACRVRKEMLTYDFEKDE